MAKDLNAWADALQPTSMSLFCAPSLNIAGMGTSEADKTELQLWSCMKIGELLMPVLCGSPALEMSQKTDGLEMNAGPFMSLSGEMSAPRIDLQHHTAGTYLDHDGFRLFGCNRWKTDVNVEVA